MLAIVLAAILLLRILGLAFSQADLHYDEARYWFWSHELDFGYYSRPPALMWLISLVTQTCGDSEFCIRLPSPIIATASAFLIYALALRLYDRRVAFWASVVYATLPAVSAFAMVAVPENLLAFFLIAGLLMLSVHFERPTIASGIGLAVVVGLGLETDYAMIYLPICTAIYIAATPKVRHVLRAPATWVAIALAVLIAAPNLFWDARNELITFREILATSGWAFRRLNPDATLAFIGLQFVLFGPILLFVLLRSVLARRTIAPRAASDRFLLFHCVPIMAAMLVEAIFFRARAHWTMPAFPAAAVFVTALLLRHGFNRLLLVSTAIHAAILVAIVGLGVFATRFVEIPFDSRMIGWRDFAEGLHRAASVSEVKTIVLRGSDQVSEALYYLRGTDLDIRAFNPRGRRPTDDFERRRSWAYGDPDTVLLATARDLSAFGIPLGAADKIGEFPVRPSLSPDRIYSLYRVNPPPEDAFPQ
jgi:4-amino-4-deoxy-L-arabinose transferase-like glycosyltransferase